MVNVAIIGGSGYTGLELMRLLARHPGVELRAVTSREFEGKPVSIVLPQIVEAKVETTAEPIHAQQDSAFKEATLENGVQIRVPLFIAPGEIVRVEVKTGRYVDRVRSDKKKGA